MKKSRGKQQAPVCHQLMVFLHFVGIQGTGANNAGQRNVFGISRGSAQVYRDRVVAAICSLRDEYVKWPAVEERASIATRIGRDYDFPNCVGIADGTLFPLGSEPQTDDAPDYHGRKFRYSLSVMIICDDTRRITYYLSGWPGSAHDNRVFRSTKIANFPNQFMSPLQYIIGDSAFENDWFIVSAFKKPAGTNIELGQELFNEKMASLRIISEHTIGLLKGCFPWLRHIPMIIKDDKKSFRKILNYIDATIILHNLLLDFNSDECDEFVEDDDVSAVDASDEPAGDNIFHPIQPGAVKDQRRRDLLNYFIRFNPKFSSRKAQLVPFYWMSHVVLEERHNMCLLL